MSDRGEGGGLEPDLFEKKHSAAVGIEDLNTFAHTGGLIAARSLSSMQTTSFSSSQRQ
jgi:hypothetical protein